MLQPEEVAALFDQRPGYKLVDFEEVGLPIYKFTSTVLTLVEKQYPAIDEFILRSIELEVTDIGSIAGLLGVDDRIIEASASSLIRDVDIVERPDSRLALTSRSRAALAGEAVIRPREQSVVFHFDALTRKPIGVNDLRLLSPSELRRRGLREVRTYPVRKPEPEDIDADILNDVLRGGSSRSDGSAAILRVRGIGRRVALFAPAVALVYRREGGDDVRVAFAIDGRLSEEHERAFLEADGPTKSGIRDSVLGSEPAPALSSLLGKDLAKAVELARDSSSASSTAMRTAAIARFKSEIARKRGAPEPEAPNEVSPNVETVRPVPVYEHPKLLAEAFDTARARLIVISPWITDAVVDTAFLQRLRRTIQRGVKLYIGYGLGAPEPAREGDALRELKKIAREDERFTLVCLGDTHAKVLVKDSDWFVTTSFNWLSFRGDPKRAFREEWGTKVAIKGVVAKYAADLMLRFAPLKEG